MQKELCSVGEQQGNANPPSQFALCLTPVLILSIISFLASVVFVIYPRYILTLRRGSLP